MTDIVVNLVENGATVTAEPYRGSNLDTTAIHKDTDAEISVITEKATPVNADLILIEDSADGNSKKRVQAGNLEPL